MKYLFIKISYNHTNDFLICQRLDDIFVIIWGAFLFSSNLESVHIRMRTADTK